MAKPPLDPVKGVPDERIRALASAIERLVEHAHIRRGPPVASAIGTVDREAHQQAAQAGGGQGLVQVGTLAACRARAANSPANSLSSTSDLATRTMAG